MLSKNNKKRALSTPHLTGPRLGRDGEDRVKGGSRRLGGVQRFLRFSNNVLKRSSSLSLKNFPAKGNQEATEGHIH